MGKRSRKQWGTETGELWKGEGWGGVQGVNKMDTTGTQGILRWWLWGWLTEVEKIMVFGGGRKEMVVNN